MLLCMVLLAKIREDRPMAEILPIDTGFIVGENSDSPLAKILYRASLFRRHRK